MSLIFRHKLVHDTYKHYKFTELRPTYSNTLVCFKYFILLNLHSKIPIEVFGICEKNKPERGANFIVRPREQNCLVTPLCGFKVKGNRWVWDFFSCSRSPMLMHDSHEYTFSF